VALAVAAGATNDEIVASLEAVTPVTGSARVVQCAPKVALALGYDVERSSGLTRKELGVHATGYRGPRLRVVADAAQSAHV
jgi:hypothetical protein